MSYLHVAPPSNSQTLQLSQHESYRLVITDPQRSYYVKSINRQWRKSAPPFLSTSHCEFYGTVCAPTYDEPSLPARFARYLRISTFIVCRINNLKFVEIGSASLQIWPYKILPSTKIFLRGRRFFFLLSFFHFHRTLFSWACGSLRESRKFFQTLFLYIHLFV